MTTATLRAPDLGDRLRPMREGQDATRWDLIGLACARLWRARYVSDRMTVLGLYVDAWELLAVEGAECDAARAVVVSSIVDALTEDERYAFDCHASASDEWAVDLRMIDVDADGDSEGWHDCSSWTTLGDECRAEVERRWEAERAAEQESADERRQVEIDERAAAMEHH